jgi:hypothetical protein
MMPQEERVDAMVRSGAITAAEGERLLVALRTRRRELPGPRVLVSPMEYLSTRMMAILTVIGAILGIIVEHLGIRFDGALDVHPSPIAPTFGLALFDIVNAMLVPAVFCWSASWLLARQGRFVDFVLAIGVARLPLVVIGLLAAWALPPWEDLSRQTLTSAPGGKVVIMSVLATPLYVWFITLLYRGFRTSSGLIGRRSVFAFVIAFVGAELMSKFALMIGYVLLAGG